MPPFGFQEHLYSHENARTRTHKKNEDWSGEEGKKREKGNKTGILLLWEKRKAVRLNGSLLVTRSWKPLRLSLELAKASLLALRLAKWGCQEVTLKKTCMLSSEKRAPA